MQASAYTIDHSHGCDGSGDAPRSTGATLGIAMWPSGHVGARARGSGPGAGTAQALAPIGALPVNRRASHCSGVTATDGRPQPPTDPRAPTRAAFCTRRRTPTDVEGLETARFATTRAGGSSSDHGISRQAPRGVKFIADGGTEANSAVSEGSADSDGSSEDDSFPHTGRSRKGQVLELPALPLGGTSSARASACGGVGGFGGSGGVAAGPAGVTLAFLESLRAASRPGTTLRDLYGTLVLPATRAARCAYVALLGAEYRARPTHVLVCSWDERISDVVDCVADHVAAQQIPAIAAPQPQPSAQHQPGAGGKLTSTHLFDASGGGLALRHSVDHLPLEYQGIGAATAAAAAPGTASASTSRSPSPSPCAGGAGCGSTAGVSSSAVAVWLDLFAVNFHPPASGLGFGAASAGGLGAAARWGQSAKSLVPSLDDTALERARALPSAVASTRSVLLLPGAEGAGLREHPVTLAAWHALRGRGCAGGAALAVVAPPDLDVALVQAAFENLAVSAAKGAEEPSGSGPRASSGVEVMAGGGSGGGQSLSPTHASASADRLAVRAAREGAAGGGAAAAGGGIFAADPLPSRTVKEGLTAATIVAANVLLLRPVGHSTPRQCALQTAASLPPAGAPAPAAPPSPLLQPSTPQLLSPSTQHAHHHNQLQGRSFSVNTLEPMAPTHMQYSSYAPLPLTTSRLSLLSGSPLRAGSGNGVVSAAPSARSLMLPSDGLSSSQAAAAAARPAVPSPSPPLASVSASASAAGRSTPAAPTQTASAVPTSLLRAPSGRSVSFTSLPLKGLAADDDDDDDDGVPVTAVTEARVGPFAGGGGGGALRFRAGRMGTTVIGIAGGAEGPRGSWTGPPSGAVSYEATGGGGGGGGGEASGSARRLRSLIPPLDVTSPLSPSPPPALASPAGLDLSTGSGRLLQMRCSTVAPWEASSPLPTLPNRSPSGAVGSGSAARQHLLAAFATPLTPGAADGGAGDDDAAAAATAMGTGAPPSPPLAASLSPLGPRALAPLEQLVPLSGPLPRLAPLHLPTPSAVPPPGLTPMASAAAAATPAVGSGLSAPLPQPLLFRDVEPAAVSVVGEGEVPCVASPFGRKVSYPSRVGDRASVGYSRDSAGYSRDSNGYSRDSTGGSRGALRRDTAQSAASGRMNPDADLDLQSTSEAEPPSDLDPDPEDDVPGIVLESLNSVPLGQDTRGAVVGHLHAGSKPSPTGGAGNSAPAAGAAAPESPLMYDPAPYRPLAPDLARLVGAGRLLAALGQPAAAVRVVRHALTAARSLHGSTHPDTARCASALGWILLHCQQQPTTTTTTTTTMMTATTTSRSSGREAGGGPSESGCGVDFGGGGGSSGGAVGSFRSRRALTSYGGGAPPPPPAASATGAEAAAAERAASGGELPGAASAPVGGILSGGPLGSNVFRSAASPSRTRLGPHSPSAPWQLPGPGVSGGGGGGGVDGPGGVEEAASLLRGAAAVLERFLGPDNEETLRARQGLAAALAAEGRYDEALPLLQRAATGRAARRRSASEVVVGSAIDLAVCLAATGRAKEARKMLRASLARLLEDEDEAATATATAAAAPVARSSRAGSAVGVFVAGQGPGSSSSPYLLAGGLRSGGGSAAAAAAAMAAVSSPGSVNGSASVSPLPTVSGGAAQLATPPASTPSPAGQQQERALPLPLTALKREELRAKATHQLAQLKAACGKSQAARILYRSALQSYTTVYGRSHAVTAGCMLSLAALDHSLREYGEALELYRAVMDLYVEMYGPYHPATTRVSNRLGELEEAMEEEEEDESSDPPPMNTALARASLRRTVQYRGPRESDEEEEDE